MKGIVKKLCDIDGIAIPAEMLEVHVDDKQVEQAIERLSLRYAKECPAETAQNGDLVRCHAEAGDGRPILLYPGMATAIIGGNGAGKSTLFKLLTRLYEPKSGAIRFGGDNIADFALTGWRDRCFAYVFQKDPLIGGTVRENITYSLDREVSEEELIAAAKKANCYDCIMAKPGGFDEDVGLGGSNFSGGQAQCISIARAMLRDADYLLLDEATSNLDVVSEAAVTEAMDHLMEGRTTIMIAHNFAATRNADYIIVMKDGTVEASGTPEELQETNEYYRMFSKTL